MANELCHRKVSYRGAELVYKASNQLCKRLVSGEDLESAVVSSSQLSKRRLRFQNSPLRQRESASQQRGF